MRDVNAKFSSSSPLAEINKLNYFLKLVKNYIYYVYITILKLFSNQCDHCY